ncbi:MAG: DUF2812 domain-containing protein [Acutalibacteraceae bacterium]
MKTKNGLVRHFISFDYSEIAALSEYLEKCESEGLRFRHKSNMFLYFERCEPKKVRYSAEVFKPIKNAWFGKTEMNSDFVDLCRQAGWQLVDFDGASLYVFRSEDMDAVPIMTDEKKKLSIVAKEFINKYVLPQILVITIWLLNFATRVASDSLFDISDVLLLFVISLLLLYMSVRIFLSLLRWRKSRKRLENAQKTEYGELKEKTKKDLMRAAVMNGCVLLLFLLISCLYIGTFGRMLEIVLLAVSAVLIVGELFMLRSGKDFLTAVRRKHAMVYPPVAALLIVLLLSPFVMYYQELEQPSHQAARYDSTGQMEIDERTIPVTLSDFGIREAQVENTTVVRGTRFARVGEYSSVQNTDGFGADENDAYGEMLDYAVCISPYQRMRDSFLNEHTKYMSLTDESVALGSGKWDRVYYRKTEYRDFIGCCVAEKGDVLLILDYPTLEEIDETLNLFYDRMFQ